MKTTSRPSESWPVIDTDSEPEVLHHHRRPRANQGRAREAPVKAPSKEQTPIQKSVTIDAKEAGPSSPVPLVAREHRRDYGRRRNSRTDKSRFAQVESKSRRACRNEEVKAKEEAEKKKKEAEEKELDDQRKKMEEFERQAAEKKALEHKMQLEKLEALERRLEAEMQRERVKKEMRDEEGRKLLDDRERMLREASIKTAAVEEYKQEEERRRLEEERHRASIQKEYRAEIEAELGYPLDQVKSIFNQLASRRGNDHIDNIERRVPRREPRRCKCSLTGDDADDETN